MVQWVFKKNRLTVDREGARVESRAEPASLSGLEIKHQGDAASLGVVLIIALIIID